MFIFINFNKNDDNKWSTFHKVKSDLMLGTVSPGQKYVVKPEMFKPELS